MFALKYLIFRKPSFEQAKNISPIEIMFIIDCALRFLFDISLAYVFYCVVVLYKSRVKNVASINHLRWSTFF